MAPVKTNRVHLTWTALWLLAACASAAPPRPTRDPTPADYFPLAVGNSWTFLDRSPQQRAPSRRTVRILRRDGEGYFLDDQRGALRADGDCLHDRSRRLLCRPFTRGHGWSSVVGPSATERYEIAGVGETVSVPAGTFHDCVRVRSEIRAGEVEAVAELTYAPGVGPVRLETFSIVKGTLEPQVSGALESFELKAR
ncbi:MAG TPA: hypothetical protein VLV17_09485 [Anaeromyxobacteraceae bacterium]|nr:hypothetical protein [Anaeromyxobacteraceae bacterium]